MVAHAHLADPELEQKLGVYASYKNVRGIRQLINWHENEGLRFTNKEWMKDDKWIAGFGLLEK